MDTVEQPQGRLIVAGCGLHPGHMTLETQSHIKVADKVLLVAPNPLSIQHIIQINPKTENLGRFYETEPNRAEIYRAMANYIIAEVKKGLAVCTVFYGHPGIFVTSTHVAIRQLKQLGYPVKMLPGISADGCLFADLNLDPASSGCQSWEATQFLLSEREWDSGALLLLWQIGLVGEHTLEKFEPGLHGLRAVSRLLLEKYDEEHQVCIYEAAIIPGFEPRADWMALKDLTTAQVSPASTLVVPAARQLKFAKQRLNWLKLSIDELTGWKTSKDLH